ncbi:MAG: hypothetical protein KGM39_02265 [Actinomycetales bacterium]|jgi:hypothetical protein|nr:hypothetical protein [Actinomycetales bacterium]
MKISNYRMLAYTQLAISLINMVYRNGDAGNFTKSLMGVVTGLVLMSLTFLIKSSGYFEKKLTLYFWSAISVIAIATALI